jgi:hypothetical protein
MTKRPLAYFRKIIVTWGLFLAADAPCLLPAQPAPAAVSAFNLYSNAVESRLAQQHRSPTAFLASSAFNHKNVERRLGSGKLIIERLTPLTGSNLSGALLHHWRGTAFAPGAQAANFEHLLRDFRSYPRHFSPQVLDARILTQQGDHAAVSMRVRQRHVITVVMDTTYDLTFGRLDAQHGYSNSQSTRIVEIASPGTSTERVLNATEEHGFLWRLNTFWSYEERDGGLYLQIEAVSLTRSIPPGLEWAIRGYVESIPREALEFTLRSGRSALQN